MVWQARGSDADEVHGAEARGLLEAGREPEPPRLGVSRQQTVEVRLEEPGAAGPQQRHLVRVDVDAEHLVPELGHARGVRGTEVPASDHRQPHASEGTRAAWTGGFRVMNAAHRDVVGQPGKRGGPLAEKCGAVRLPRITASSASSSANAARRALSQAASGRRLRWPETVSAACARKSLKLNVSMRLPSASSPGL